MSVDNGSVRLPPNPIHASNSGKLPSNPLSLGKGGLSASGVASHISGAKSPYIFHATPGELPPGDPRRMATLNMIAHHISTAVDAAPFAKQLKAMNITPEEEQFVNGRLKDLHEANSRAQMHDLTHTVLPGIANAALGATVGSNHHFEYAIEHPIARLEGKGPFKTKPGEIMGANDTPFLPGESELSAAVKGAEGANAVGRTTEEAAAHVVDAARTARAQGHGQLGPKTLGETVTEGLQGAKQTRQAQEALRAQERARRIKEYGKIVQADPTEAGHIKAMSELKGKYPAIAWGNFKEFNQETVDAMHKFITDHPNVKGWEEVRAKNAITKIRQGIVPQRNEEKLLRKIFGNDTTKQMMDSVSKFRQIKALGYDVANIPRAVMASGDASGLLRQALLIATGHPGIWAKSVPTYLKAIKSEDFYNAGLAILHNRPNALNGVYDRMGLDLTELTPRGGNMAAREEQFRSPLAEKIPGVRASGRGFMLGLDQARADLADLMYAKAVKAGRANDDHLLQSIGDVVNSASGRGDLGNGVIGRSQEGLNLLLFSPRLIKSRIDFLNPVWYARLDPIARHEAYRAMSGLVVLVAAANVIARAAGASINLDPRSSDFAKIRIGNVRIDLAGGFQQYMHLLGEIATQHKVTSTGKTIKFGQEGPGKTSDWDVLFGFLRSKLAPMTSAAVDITQRQNTVGQPLSWSNSLLSRVTPLAGQDAYQVGQDAWQSHGPAAGIAAGIGGGLLSAFGGGVQQYVPRQPKVTSVFDPYAPTGSSSGGGYWDTGTSSGGSGYWGK